MKRYISKMASAICLIIILVFIESVTPSFEATKPSSLDAKDHETSGGLIKTYKNEELGFSIKFPAYAYTSIIGCLPATGFADPVLQGTNTSAAYDTSGGLKELSTILIDNSVYIDFSETYKITTPNVSGVTECETLALQEIIREFVSDEVGFNLPVPRPISVRSMPARDLTTAEQEASVMVDRSTDGVCTAVSPTFNSDGTIVELIPLPAEGVTWGDMVDNHADPCFFAPTRMVWTEKRQRLIILTDGPYQKCGFPAGASPTSGPAPSCLDAIIDDSFKAI